MPDYYDEYFNLSGWVALILLIMVLQLSFFGFKSLSD